MINKEIILLFIFAFLPAILYVIWIRNTEKYNRERWIPIKICFLWGATLAVIAALILEVVLGFSLASSIQDSSLLSLLTVVLIAPVVEEFTKPLALRINAVKKEIDELEDGLIYGAVAGLGFSATENLFYGWSFFQEGLLIFIFLISLRSIGACLLHASATALTGYGYGKTIMKHTSLLRVLPYFLLAILIHSFYNFLVSYRMIGIVSGLGAAFLFVFIAIALVRSKIQTLDKLTC